MIDRLDALISGYTSLVLWVFGIEKRFESIKSKNEALTSRILFLESEVRKHEAVLNGKS